MAKIYQDFGQLVEQNKGLLNVVLKSGNVGILEAIWNARTPEVDLLTKRVNELELELQSQLSIDQALSTQQSIHETEMNQLEKRYNLLLSENKELRSCVDKSKNDKGHALEQVENLKLKNQSLVADKEYLSATINKLTNDLKCMDHELVQTVASAKTQIAKLRDNLHLKDEENSKLINLTNNQNDKINELNRRSEQLYNQLLEAKDSLREANTLNQKSLKMIEANESRLRQQSQSIQELKTGLSTITRELAQRRNEVSHFVECFHQFELEVKKTKKSSAKLIRTSSDIISNQ